MGVDDQEKLCKLLTCYYCEVIFLAKSVCLAGICLQLGQGLKEGLQTSQLVFVRTLVRLVTAAVGFFRLGQ